MAVIKHGGVRGMVGHGGVLDLADIERNAREVLERARAEAERIRAEACEQAQQDAAARQAAAWREGFQRGLEEGREQGLREGREAGLVAARPEIDALVAAWNSALDVFRRQRQELLDVLSREALRLAVEMARRVVHRVNEQDPEAAAAQVARALEMLGSPAQAVVVVHPDDRAAVERHLAPLAHRLAAGEVRLVEDPAVGLGGCIARAQGGEVDAAVEPMLDRIVEAILGPPQEGAAA